MEIEKAVIDNSKGCRDWKGCESKVKSMVDEVEKCIECIVCL